MLTRDIQRILNASRDAGWVIEPEAKRLLHMAGLPVPIYGWARDLEQAEIIATEIGYPVAAKIVSPEIIHKTEVKGVSLNIENREELLHFYNAMSSLPRFQGILVEEMVQGEELIVGATMDYQFGPTILVGMGGTGVEIYRDVALRMAPITQEDVGSMLQELQGRKLLEGFRGKEPINISALTETLVSFSTLLMEIAPSVDSIDINPLLCNAQGCVVADARIMLHT